MQTHWLGTDSPLWAEILAQHPHDFYHLPAYLRLAARQEGGRAVAFLAQEGLHHFFVPLVFRPLPVEFALAESLQDAISPYGYGGPLANTEDAAFLSAAVDALVAGLRERGVVSAFVRLHPLLPLARA